MELSVDQRGVYDAVLDWLHSGSRQVLKFGGLAGTGKTTLLAALANRLSGDGRRVVFATFTGKASTVLARKLRAAEIDNSCGTLHSLMYRPQIDEETGAIIGWERKPVIPADLVVVDEASMLGSGLWQDLLDYGIPILAVGDHGQLPPVSPNSVNLMEDPDLTLTKIHRQAAGNPILALAHHVRDGRSLSDFRTIDDRVRFVPRKLFHQNHLREFADSSLDRVILCAYNTTRIRMNADIRKLRGYTKLLEPGEPVICLRNTRPIFNGMRGVVLSRDEEPDERGRFWCELDFPEDRQKFHALVQSRQFGLESTLQTYNELPGKPRSWGEVGHLFDYGYSMTVHKAQGSEFSKVAVAVEWFSKSSEDDKVRWIYTAITRASEQLYLVM